jgi:hypothetical protein
MKIAFYGVNLSRALDDDGRNFDREIVGKMIN